MNAKIIAALVIVGVLAVAVVGLVSAQIATPSPNPNGTTNTVQNDGFFGWIGRCFRFGGAPYYGTQAPTTGNQPLNITVTDPNTNTTTSYQAYPGYGMPYLQNQPTTTNPGTTAPNQGYYGYGGCMRRFIP